VDGAVDNHPGLAVRLLRIVPGLALVAVGILLGVAFGYLRALVAIAFGAVILWLGTSYFRAAGEVPPEPAAEDVSSSSLKYVCSVCGLELKVEVATTDRAPTHCREAMVLVRETDARPPLRPI
jgi:hypothetical protein